MSNKSVNKKDENKNFLNNFKDRISITIYLIYFSIISHKYVILVYFFLSYFSLIFNSFIEVICFLNDLSAGGITSSTDEIEHIHLSFQSLIFSN